MSTLDYLSTLKQNVLYKMNPDRFDEPLYLMDFNNPDAPERPSLGYRLRHLTPAQYTGTMGGSAAMFAFGISLVLGAEIIG